MTPDEAAAGSAVSGAGRSGGLVDRHVTVAAETCPGGLAVVDGDVRIDYRTLEASIRSVAAGLAGLDVEAGSVVSWQLPNWHEAVILHHAVLRLGAISNPITPIYRHREVGHILAEAGSEVVVIPHRFRGFDHPAMIADLRPDLPRLREVLQVRQDGTDRAGFGQLLEADPAALASVERDADQPILLMFTSGTTARPKGVLHTHATLDYENRSIIDVYGLGPDDIVFMPSPLTHITGLLYGMQMPAMLGAPVVLQDVWDAGAALRLIESERCTFTLAATPFLHGLMAHPDRADHDVSSLRVFACGGADVPAVLIREADQRGCRATRVYGSTEFPTLTTSPPEAPLDKRASTDGCAIAAAEFRIVDEGAVDVSPGSTGELIVRGPEQFIRYLRPEDNDGALTPDGWFRTGDLAAVDADGYLIIRGRSKDIIIRGGENISVAEVEQLLYEHPDVSEVAVVSMPDPVLGERACAYVVAAPGAAPTLADILAFLEDKGLARQKLPERLEVVDELPKTLSGKVQKFRLREMIRARLERRAEEAVR